MQILTFLVYVKPGKILTALFPLSCTMVSLVHSPLYFKMCPLKEPQERGKKSQNNIVHKALKRSGLIRDHPFHNAGTSSSLCNHVLKRRLVSAKTGAALRCYSRRGSRFYDVHIPPCLHETTSLSISFHTWRKWQVWKAVITQQSLTKISSNYLILQNQYKSIKVKHHSGCSTKRTRGLDRNSNGFIKEHLSSVYSIGSILEQHH